MKKKFLIIIGIVIVCLFLLGLVTSYKDSARVRAGIEPKYVVKTISYHGDKDLIIGKKGSIINDYNYAMFNYKIKSSGYPIELKVDKTTITTKCAKFTINNNFDDEYNYGAEYRIDKKVFKSSDVPITKEKIIEVYAEFEIK